MEGTSFGKYRLIELLGRGGMGEVWRAYDADTQRAVALKILPADISTDEVFQQRFRREAYATARLNSPHLIPIHTYGEIDRRLYVDMRLIEGHDLQWLLSRGPLQPDRAVRIIDQVAKGLNAAHKDGLVHRDVKPSNILLDADDFAYLIDFGIARAADDMPLTAVGNIIGTCHYMAPERFSNVQADARSDIYSLACVLYECLTAQSPFPGKTLQQQITGHLSTPPPRPSSTNPGLPGGLDAVIARGMAKDPGDRYDTPVELARAAHHALTVRTAAAPQPHPRPQPPPRPQPTGPHQTQAGPYPDIRARPPAPAPQSVPPAPTMARPLPNAVAVSRPQPAPAQPADTRSPSRPWWRRKAVAISAAALVAVAAIVIALVVVNKPSKSGEFEQVTLPFTGLLDPQGLSVDYGGTVYVADTPHNRILTLHAGSNEQAELPIEGLSYPTGVTADNSGNIYINNAGRKEVLLIRANSGEKVVLHFADLGNPTGLTVDSSRTVYVTDTAKNRVVALAAGSETQTEVPFTGLNGPTGLVVTSSGTVYVSDGGNNRILMLPVDTKKQVALPFSGLKEPGGVTLDSQGAVYVTDRGNSRALKLPAGSTSQVVLPFTGLDYPWGLAVDNNGNVYVGGRNDKIVMLQKK